MRSRNFVLGLLASVLVVAVAIGLLVLVDRTGGDDLELPDRLGGLSAYDSERAYERLDEDRRDETRKRHESQTAYNESELSDALDGAEVVARSYYSLEDGEGPAAVTVVAADADMGALLPEGGFPQPEASGVALPLVERVETGDVECLLRRVDPPRFGDDYDEEDLAPSSVLCQRTSGSLSVRVSAGDGATVDQIAGYVDDLYDDLD
jgi:hypothetical protein